MSKWLRLEWEEVFVPTSSLPEILIRGTAIFLGLWLLLRVIPKREAGGSVSVNDLMFAAVVGSLASEFLAKRSESVTDFFLVMLVVLVWNYALDWLAHRFPRLRNLIEEPPTRLVKDGRILRKNLDKEMLSEDDLMAQLRLEGVDDVKKVREARLESDGSVSVVKREDEGGEGGPAGSVRL